MSCAFADQCCQTVLGDLEKSFRCSSWEKAQHPCYQLIGFCCEQSAAETTQQQLDSLMNSILFKCCDRFVFEVHVISLFHGFVKTAVWDVPLPKGTATWSTRWVHHGWHWVLHSWLDGWKGCPNRVPESRWWKVLIYRWVKAWMLKYQSSRVTWYAKIFIKWHDKTKMEIPFEIFESRLSCWNVAFQTKPHRMTKVNSGNCSINIMQTDCMCKHYCMLLCKEVKEPWQPGGWLKLTCTKDATWPNQKIPKGLFVFCHRSVL